VPLALTGQERREVLALLRLPTVQKRVFLRGQALLLMADGVVTADVAALVGVHERTVWKWKKRFEHGRVERLADAPRSGRPPSLSRRRTAPRS
jgi:transposase